MTDKQLQAIKRHGKRLLAIFPNATERDPVKLCKQLRALEVQAHGIAERECSGPVFSDPETPHTLRGVILRKVENLLGNGEGTNTPNVFVNSDPRGYALKISAEYVKVFDLDIAKDWGGYGLIAPEFNAEGE